MESSVWDPVETVSQDEMAVLQAERLRDCLARMVVSVPFYREKLGAMGVAPEDVRSLDDLARLPFTIKQDLRDSYPLRAFRGAYGMRWCGFMLRAGRRAR